LLIICYKYNEIPFKGFSPLGSQKFRSSDYVLKNPVLNIIAEKLGKTPAQVALRWGIQTGHSVLPKTSNEARLKENIDIFNWSIPEDLMAKFSEIKQASTSNFNLFCFLQNLLRTRL